jgi:hypothetical protein
MVFYYAEILKYQFDHHTSHTPNVTLTRCVKFDRLFLWKTLFVRILLF